MKKIDQQTSIKKNTSHLMATFTAVTLYHPLRTVATHLGAGQKVILNPKVLYRGFFWSACGANQLFVMSFCERRLREEMTQGDPSAFKRVAIGAIAGFSTTLFVTPLDMLTTQRQLNKPLNVNLFRGFMAVGIRQMGLGIGMFTVPHFLRQQFRREDKLFMASSAFVAGALAAIATHYPEVVRVLLQIDAKGTTYPKALAAFKTAWLELFAPRFLKILGNRVTVIAIATMVMNTAPQFFQNILSDKGA